MHSIEILKGRTIFTHKEISSLARVKKQHLIVYILGGLFTKCTYDPSVHNFIKKEKIQTRNLKKKKKIGNKGGILQQTF